MYNLRSILISLNTNAKWGVKMAKKIIFSILIVLLLVISCEIPQGPFSEQKTPEEPPNYWYLGARGTPLYVYLDGNYDVLEQESSAQTGRTAVFIDGNTLAEGVLAVSEISTDDYDDAVHLINQNANTIVSIFFRKGQVFPWLIDIAGNDREAKARLFGYDWGYERFTMEFEENGISNTIKNIKLSQNALTDYVFAPSLTKEQNIRLRNIFTVLGVYESVSRSLPKNTGSAGTVISSTFNDKSFISFAATVKPARIITSALEYIKSENPAYFVVDVLNIIDPSLLEPLIHVKYIPPTPNPLSVTINSNGVPVDPQRIHHIERGGEMTVNFKFTNLTQDTNVNVVWYDPYFHWYLPKNGTVNSVVYSHTQEDGSPIGRFTEDYSIKIKRNMTTGSGFHDGTAAFLILFGQDTVVNDNTAGINFWEPGTSGLELHKSIFMIQFTVQPDKATP